MSQGGKLRRSKTGRTSEKDKPPKLTLKQELFVSAYLGASMGNATDAARRAGYKGNANQLASVGTENLRKPAIATAIQAQQKKILEPLIWGREELQDFWSRVSSDRTVAMPHRLRASELLGKSQGLFIEKREVTKTGATKPKRKPPTREELADKARRAQRVIDAIKSKEEQSEREPTKH